MKKLLTTLLLITAFSFVVAAQDQTPPPIAEKLTTTVGKSLIIDSSVNIQRVSVANGELVEAVAVSSREILITGKGPGNTSIVVWQQNGNRLLYDLTIRPSPARLDAVRTQEVQRVESQVLLRLRFASVDRNAETDLGLNLLSNAFDQTTAVSGDGQTLPTVTRQPLNIFLVKPDIDVLATIKALQARNALELLADANVMAIDGKQASFVAGGEFPFPTLQGGKGVTIQFREFGVRLNFLPNITPRGTIRLQVAPEVSSLDYANAITIQGFPIPALTTRHVLAEVELDRGQSFVIRGLLDHSTTENLSKMPGGLANIPIFGKLFQSKSTIGSNSGLLVIITPEIMRPLAASGPAPHRYPMPPIRLQDSPLPPYIPAVPSPVSSPGPGNLL